LAPILKRLQGVSMVEDANENELWNKKAKKEPRTVKALTFWLMFASFVISLVGQFFGARLRNEYKRECDEYKREIARLEKEVRELKMKNDIRPRLY
jgi:hypothetical protein